MLNDAVLLLYLLNFLFIALLPAIFFRHDGSLNVMWWLTAAPFFFCAAFLIAAYVGLFPAAVDHNTRVGDVLELASVVLSTASIALIALTLGTHRIPIALWHQDNDTPEHIVTYGAYRYIRHPFYAAFLLTLFGAFLFAPHPVTLITFVYGLIALNLTAAKEEVKLSTSKFGTDYVAHQESTGRFWPKFWRIPQ